MTSPLSLPDPPIVASRNAIDFMTGVEHVTRTRRIVAANIRIVPGVAARIAGETTRRGRDGEKRRVAKKTIAEPCHL
jgi:hypothetical protein